MKIAVTSDTHGNLPEIEPCEVLCICGDVSPLKEQLSIILMEEWICSEFIPWINKLPCNQVIMTPGNHDFYFEYIKDNDSRIYEIFTKPTKGKLEILYNTVCNILSEDGNVYKIFGTPYCKIFGRWAFMVNDEMLQKYYSEMPKDCDIIITHDSPSVGKYGTIQEGKNKGVNAGNKLLAEEIKLKSPKYVFSGHIHSGEHVLGNYKGYTSKFANVSYLNESYNNTYNVLYLEI